ncbi:MAG: hypothetical protein NC099_01990 [Corallococcus sp.]|nr:hypothetical protein [Bacillota bacterium]MCM1533401.1 hypothetical protein [Corallococcus sp.]
MKKEDKNVSKNVPNGRTLQARDNNFFGQKNYVKPGYEKKGNYRRIVVIDSNDLDDLAVVKLTTSNKGISLTYSNGKSKFRPFVLTKDDDGQPIRAGVKFIPNSPSKDLSKSDVSKIKKEVFTNSKTGTANRNKVRKMKGRK